MAAWRQVCRLPVMRGPAPLLSGIALSGQCEWLGFGLVYRRPKRIEALEKFEPCGFDLAYAILGGARPGEQASRAHRPARPPRGHQRRRGADHRRWTGPGTAGILPAIQN